MPGPLSQYYFPGGIAPVEVKLAVTSHTLSGEMLESNKPLTFLLDPLKDREESGKPSKKKQKKDKGQFTDKNFGSVVDIAQCKNAKRLVVAWRARRFHQ